MSCKLWILTGATRQFPTTNTTKERLLLYGYTILEIIHLRSVTVSIGFPEIGELD